MTPMTETPEKITMPDSYYGMADKDRLRKLADVLDLSGGSKDDVLMLRIVAATLEENEEKPPLPARWGGVDDGSFSPVSKRRFIDLIGVERLQEISLHDHRVVAIERKIRSLEESVSGDDGIVAKAWYAALAAKRAYFAAHRKREDIWRKIVNLRFEQRRRVEQLMRDELTAHVNNLRSKVNLTFVRAPKGSNRKFDRRKKERIEVIPRHVEVGKPQPEDADVIETGQ